MPDVDSQLAALSRGVIFTILDLSNGFLQISLTPAAKEKTAFVIEEATAKFERMPFGLKGLVTRTRRCFCRATRSLVKMYNPNAAITQVHTDASSHALSGVLLQGSSTTSLHMVYAVSKKTTTAESKYHSSRLELYAIIWTLNRLRQFLLGIQFVVYTIGVLVYLNIHKTTKPQIERWFEVLHQFDFVIKYRPGSGMAYLYGVKMC